MFNGKIWRETVRVPTKEDGVGNRLDIHMRASDRGAIIGGIFDDFFVKAPVLAPTSDHIEGVEIEGELLDVEVRLNEVRDERVLLFLAECPANQKLKEPNLAFHGAIWK